jgi:small subunit ribosomal protein S20
VAHSLSAKKRIRQNLKARARNKARKTALKTKLKKVQDSFLHGAAPDAEKACLEAVRTLDREATRGTLHRNAAARRKSRMARRLNAMKQAAAS